MFTSFVSCSSVIMGKSVSMDGSVSMGSRASMCYSVDNNYQ